MSIDTEGFDLKVLKSNDWKKFKPKLICIESSHHSASGVSKKITNHESILIKEGYSKVYDNLLNSIWLINKVKGDL